VTRPRNRARGLAVLALADQCVISGVSFLTTIIIGRACGKMELGLYALGMSVVLLAIAAQQSLISAAHTVFSVRLEGLAYRRYNGSIALQFVALNLVIMLGLGVVATLAYVAGSEGGTAQVLVVLVVVCPSVLVREFARRFQFARFQTVSAFLLDTAIAVLQVALLGGLMALSWLSGATGLLAVGCASALVGLFWGVTNRREFELSGTDHAAEFARGWRFGRWVFGGQMLFTSVAFVIQWTIAYLMDEAAVGVYSACMTLVLLANPVVLGLQNLLSPSIAKAMHDGGVVRVRQLVGQSTLALSLMLSAFVAVLGLWGDAILVALYGESFAGNGLVVALLGGGMLATATGVSSNHGLRTLERPELNFMASLGGLLTGVTTAYLMIPSWGVSGAAMGFAISCTITSAVRLVCFASISRLHVGDLP